MESLAPDQQDRTTGEAAVQHSPISSSFLLEDNDGAYDLRSNKEGDDDDDDDGDDDEYAHLFQSIRSPTGLEIGVRVTWPGVQPLELSTCLPEDEIAPMFHGTQWAGTRVWKAAIVALQYLLDEQQGPLYKEGYVNSNNNNNNRNTNSFSCLELGCGLGVPSMILHARFPASCRVVLTDCGSLVPQLRQNLQQNFGSDDTASTNSMVTAAALDWEEPANLQQLLHDSQLESFDVVLNCDCIYEPLYGKSWKALLSVQVALLQRKCTALVLTSLERRKFDGAEKYLHELRQHPLVAKVELVHTDDPVEIYRIHGKTTL